MNKQEKSFLLKEAKETQERKLFKDSSSSEEWGGDDDSSSYSSSLCYSGCCSDDSYVANWEDYVQPDGSLFYIEYNNSASVGHHKSSAASFENALSDMRNNFNRLTTRRSAHKMKSSKFPFHKNNNKISATEEGLENSKNTPGGTASTIVIESGNELVESSLNFEEIKVEVLLNPENRFKFGRRASITESLLGLSTSPFPDGERLMISGFMGNSYFSSENLCKIGDWLKMINEEKVTVKNIEALLLQYKKPSPVIVTFQRIAETENMPSTLDGSCGHEKERKAKRIGSFEEFVNISEHCFNLNANSCKENEKKEENMKLKYFNLLILNREFMEVDQNVNDVIFCFPDRNENDLLNVRGAFVTLNSILKMELKSDPISSTVEINNRCWNLCYYSNDKVIILLGIPAAASTLKECRLRMEEFISYIEMFLHGIDLQLFEKEKQDFYQICKLYNLKLSQEINSLRLFENLLPESRMIALPKEAQLRIFDALSEMGAMDYRDWNEEPLNSHREFFFLGSAVFYKSRLLANLLPIAQLLAVENYLRLRGIFDFIERQSIHDLLIWKEIKLELSTNRYILAICGRNKLIIAAILQVFEAEPTQSTNAVNVTTRRNINPSLFYLEEIQDTLDHLRHGGIESLTRTWVTANRRPEICNPSEENANEKTAISKKKLTESAYSKIGSTSSDDVRVSSSLGGSSVHSLTHSEDSNHKFDTGDSDSDWNGFQDAHRNYTEYALGDRKDPFLKEISGVMPSRITAGKENVLVYYVHLDIGAGLILSPPGGQICSPVVEKFYLTCQLIHTILQNTKRFKKLLSQEGSKPNNHRSLVAIKEHGVLIKIADETYWIIGRLFSSPSRELYICHRSDVPQNLVEIAYRLSFLTSG